MQKFQERIGSEFFKNGREIAKADYNIKHIVDQGEMAIQLYHVNGSCMSMIFHTKASPLSVRIGLEQAETKIFSIIVDDKDIFNDWVYLQGALFFHRSLELKSTSVSAKTP